jgi:hypothetical protein
MRVFALGLFAASISFAGLSQAEAAPQFPKGAVALEKQLMAAQSQEAKDFIKDEAEHEAASRILSEETPRNAARKFGSAGNEVSAMAFLVLMQASRDADLNVSELVSGVQSADASREDIRQQAMTNSGIAGSQQAQPTNGENPIENALKPANDVVAAPPMSLQDAMDRQNQIDDLLVAAMKRITPPG